MQSFLAMHINNIVMILLLFIYVVCLNGLFSMRRRLIKWRRFFAFLFIISTVIVPLIVKLARVLELFGLNNQTSSSNDIFLYALPYLGLPEVAIIVVTIFINILGISYWNRGAEDVMAK